MIFSCAWAVLPADARCPGAGLIADLRKGPRAFKVPLHWVQEVDRSQAGHRATVHHVPREALSLAHSAGFLGGNT